MACEAAFHLSWLQTTLGSNHFLEETHNHPHPALTQNHTTLYNEVIHFIFDFVLVKYNDNVVLRTKKSVYYCNIYNEECISLCEQQQPINDDQLNTFI